MEDHETIEVLFEKRDKDLEEILDSIKVYVRKCDDRYARMLNNFSRATGALQWAERILEELPADFMPEETQRTLAQIKKIWDL